MTHLFCQDATETLVKLLLSNGTLGCAVPRALQCQEQTQTTLWAVQVCNPGSTFLFCTASSPWQGLHSGANRKTYIYRVNQANKIKEVSSTQHSAFPENFPFSFIFTE